MRRRDVRPGPVLPDARVGVLVAPEGRVGALVGIGLEFFQAVASARFAELRRLMLESVLVEVRAEGRAAIDELLDATRAGRTVRERLDAARRDLGVVAVRHVARLAARDGVVGGYEHHDAKRGALVALAADASADALRRAAHELAMHVAFHAPHGASDDACLDRPWFRDATRTGAAALADLLGAEPRDVRAAALRV